MQRYELSGNERLPANISQQTRGVGPMSADVGHHPRRWPNISATLGGRPMFAGNVGLILV